MLMPLLWWRSLNFEKDLRYSKYPRLPRFDGQKGAYK